MQTVKNIKYIYRKSGLIHTQYLAFTTRSNIGEHTKNNSLL